MGNNVPSTERRTSPDITVKFYCPLKVMRYEYDKYGNLDYGSNTAEDLRTDIKAGSGSVWRDISKTTIWQNTLMAAGVRPKS